MVSWTCSGTMAILPSAVSSGSHTNRGYLGSHMKQRIGDACFWVLSLNGIICAVLWIILAIITGDIFISFSDILVFIFFIVAGWLIRLILTGRADIRLSLTSNIKPSI